MTFSLVGRCERTGAVGAVIASASMAVAARCVAVRAGAGAVCSQSTTDPRLRGQLLDALADGATAADALAAVVGRAPDVAYRQLTVVDTAGGAATYSGALALGDAADVHGPDAAAAGNLLADNRVPAAMLAAFQDRARADLGTRLLAALRAGLAAGGEVSPVRSAGLLIAESQPWPVTDLRVDWHADPIGELAGFWQRWQPQAGAYVGRALRPSEMAELCAGSTAGSWLGEAPVSGQAGGVLRVGVAQWTAGRDPGANLRTAEAAVRELAGRGCQLAVLPELWLCGYHGATLAADARAAAEPIDGPVQRRLAALAAEAGLVLCAGTFPELEGEQLFNTAVVYGPAGDRLLRHRKMCLYGSEPEVFRPGEAITVGDIAGIGRVGLCICFDGDFPETARALRAAGADLVLHPSAYEAAAASWWDTIYPAQALCNGQWWISANQHGGATADRMLGGSRVIAPDGRTVAAAPRDRDAAPAPELLVVDIARRDELAAAAAAAGLLWVAPAAVRSPAVISPLPPRRTEAAPP